MNMVTPRLALSVSQIIFPKAGKSNLSKTLEPLSFALGQTHLKIFYWLTYPDILTLPLKCIGLINNSAIFPFELLNAV